MCVRVDLCVWMSVRVDACASVCKDVRLCMGGGVSLFAVACKFLSVNIRDSFFRSSFGFYDIFPDRQIPNDLHQDLQCTIELKKLDNFGSKLYFNTRPLKRPLDMVRCYQLYGPLSRDNNSISLDQDGFKIW